MGLFWVFDDTLGDVVLMFGVGIIWVPHRETTFMRGVWRGSW